MDKDIATRFLDTGLRILTFHYPVRSAVGYIIAAFLWALNGAYPGIVQALAMEANNSSKTVVSLFGFIICQIKTIFDAITGKGVDEEVQKIVNLIEKSEMSPAQKSMKWAALIDAETKKLGGKRQEKQPDAKVATDE